MATLHRCRARLALLSAPLLLPLLGSGCVVAAAAVAGVAVSQEFISNANTAYFDEDSDVVWIATKTVLMNLALSPIEVDEELRAAGGTIDGALITTRVETIDMGQTKLLVGAKKYGFYQTDIADDILNRIRREIR